MSKPGRWIAGLTVGALFPFLLAVLHDVVKSPRPDESSFIFWRAAAIAALCALSEIYIGSVMVRTKHVVLVPGVIADLEGVHVWQLFDTRDVRLWWSIALVSLPSLAVVGCLAADRVSLTKAAGGLQTAGDSGEDDLILALTKERNQLADELAEAKQRSKIATKMWRQDADNIAKANGIVTLKSPEMYPTVYPPEFPDGISGYSWRPVPGILDSHPQWSEGSDGRSRCVRCGTISAHGRYSTDNGISWTQDEPACVV